MHTDPLVMRVSRNEAQSPTSKPKPSVYRIWADSLRAEAKLRTHGSSLKSWSNGKNGRIWGIHQGLIFISPNSCPCLVLFSLDTSCFPHARQYLLIGSNKYLLIGLTNIYIRWICLKLPEVLTTLRRYFGVIRTQALNISIHMKTSGTYIIPYLHPWKLCTIEWKKKKNHCFITVLFDNKHYQMLVDNHEGKKK